MYKSTYMYDTKGNIQVNIIPMYSTLNISNIEYFQHKKNHDTLSNYLALIFFFLVKIVNAFFLHIVLLVFLLIRHACLAPINQDFDHNLLFNIWVTQWKQPLSAYMLWINVDTQFGVLNSFFCSA